eukprot:jgi/Botrbrau1/2163/Bobra.101_2s0004.1
MKRGLKGRLAVAQVGLFTATMPADVAQVAKSWLRRPKTIRAALENTSISSTVVQVVQVCAEPKKPAKLLKHLSLIKESAVGQRNFPRVLVFANKVKTVRFVHETLEEAGYKVVMLHGERSQPEREEALQAFRAGKAQIMVATDVASRGLHIRNLPYVVNYDFPSRLETYTHRVGRTGRLSATGHAFSFFTRNLAPLAPPLLSLLQEHDQSVDPNLVRLAEAYQQAAAHLQRVSSKTSKASTPSSGPSSYLEAADVVAIANVGDRGQKLRVERVCVKSCEESSEDEEVVLQRMLVNPKKHLGKGDLPGLYKARPVVLPATQTIQRSYKGAHDVASRPKQRKPLPGRLRKKLARAAADQFDVQQPNIVQ